MTEIVVTFQIEDGSAEKTLKDILLDSQLNESRQAVQMLLGLPENPPCRLFLERTNEILRDNLTFREAGVRSGDKIILIPSVQSAGNSNSHSGAFSKVQLETATSAKAISLVTYKLQLTVLSDNQQTEIYDYPIELTEFYEDNPQRFFSDSNARERQSFINALQEIASREVKAFEIDKILRDWCDDISLGYRNTAVKI
ncbi:hypothetical protein DSM106972_092890 [Dulcicalothrix desertica PCC 7102]|uniref:Ubiquitin-like domain-containing protein n=1 Tax=Dulcicalothrix desertica PCC 7102 TaxID=232991 RepID=A0A3S1CLP9_9CYAN|nr:hypothetical protein [Dulcicalothrix desertica]RUS94652.1 hypothetical protein DSM106972_092890 [Dulcicalothrix desertica PCC 7102]TWH62546.1 hypothetical protein CAL7102_00037 [Dulcicalothrix desertica PCC 7102]